MGEIEGLVEEFSDVYGLPAPFSAVVPCAVQPPSRNERAQVHVANIREAFGDLVTPSVRWSELVIGAYDARTPVPLHAPGSPVARDYRAVAAALSQRGIL